MRIHHLALRTRDVMRLERFYVDELGFVESHRQGERSVWLAAGEAILMIEHAEESEPPISPGTMELVAFTITPGERRALEARLKVEGKTDFTLYVRDPDGRRVGLSHFPGHPSSGTHLPR
jgi:glyoxylase I family protein